MLVISQDVLYDCIARHKASEGALSAWLAEAKRAQWRKPHEVKSLYPSADFLGGGRVIFDIKGNHFRLVVVVAYAEGVVDIRFAGNHAEYDKIDARKV